MSESVSNDISNQKHSATSNSLLPVELVHDIVCHVLSSYYWSYFIEGEIILKGSSEKTATFHGDSHEMSKQEWDPIVTMSGIDVIFRDQTLRVGSKVLGIPRAVDGGLLEHPCKIKRRLLELHSLLNPTTPDFTSTNTRRRPAYASSQFLDDYIPGDPGSSSNPWRSTSKLMAIIHKFINHGFIAHSPFLRGYSALLVGSSAMEYMRFTDVVRTPQNAADEEDTADEDAHDEDEGGRNRWERGPATRALEVMNRVIPSLTVWSPKPVCAHLMLGLFSIAYSLHTISSICGIVGVITSCTKLMEHLEAVSFIAGIDSDRMRSLQTANRALTSSLRQLHTGESGSYQTYKPLGVPSEPPPWPNHVITYKEIIDALEMSTACRLFSEKIRWSLARAAMIWTTRKTVRGMMNVFPDEMIHWMGGRGPSRSLLWGTVTWQDREDFAEYWRALEKSYIRIFELDESQKPSDEELDGVQGVQSSITEVS